MLGLHLLDSTASWCAWIASLDSTASWRGCPMQSHAFDRHKVVMDIWFILDRQLVESNIRVAVTVFHIYESAEVHI